MKRRSVGIGILVFLGMAGCSPSQAPVVSPQDVQAHFLPNGSLRLELGEIEHIVPLETIKPTNTALQTYRCNLPDGEVWYVIECSITPPNRLLVAWNPQTGKHQISPGYVWGFQDRNMISLYQVPNPENDRPDDCLYIAGQEFIAPFPSYRWHTIPENKIPANYDPNSFLLQGATELGETVYASIAHTGSWQSDAGLTYDVWYIYYNLQMLVEGSNIHGIHRLILAHDGKPARESTCNGRVEVQDNQLVERQSNGTFRPFPARITEGL